jgi:hypothetical protein
LEPVTGAENIRRGLATKLTISEVLEIKSQLMRGERQHTIAAQFGITQSNVSLINVGKAWADVGRSTKEKG